MTPEERLTALENSLLKMNSPQPASADSLNFINTKYTYLTSLTRGDI